MVEWWEKSTKSPDKAMLPILAKALGINHEELLLEAGIIPQRFLPLFRDNPGRIHSMLESLSGKNPPPENSIPPQRPEPAYTTTLGQL